MSTLNVEIKGSTNAGETCTVTLTVRNGMLDIWILDFERISRRNGRGRPSWVKGRDFYLTYEDAKRESDSLLSCPAVYRNIDIKSGSVMLK